MWVRFKASEVLVLKFICLHTNLKCRVLTVSFWVWLLDNWQGWDFWNLKQHCIYQEKIVYWHRIWEAISFKTWFTVGPSNCLALKYLMPTWHSNNNTKKKSSRKWPRHRCCINHLWFHELCWWNNQAKESSQGPSNGGSRVMEIWRQVVKWKEKICLRDKIHDS